MSLVYAETEEQILEQRIPMSFEEYEHWENVGGLTEWVYGEGIIFMAATSRHQMVVGFLYWLLKSYVDFHTLGQVLTAPVRMCVVPGAIYREPDIAFVATTHMYRLNDKEIVGAATLVVEVISPDSVKRDYHDKFHEYESLGVDEFWIVDIRARHEQVQCFTRTQQGRFVPLSTDSKGNYHSLVLPGFWFHPAWAVQFPLPDARRIMARIAPQVLQDKQMLQRAEQRAEQRGKREGLLEGKREGLLIGIQLMLDLKFGATGQELFEEISHLQDIGILEDIQRACKTANTLDDVRTVYGSGER